MATANSALACLALAAATFTSVQASHPLQAEVPEVSAVVHSQRSKIVRTETFDWDAEMHNVAIDVMVLVVFIIVFGFFKIRGKKASSSQKCLTRTVQIKQSGEGKQQPTFSTLATLSPAREILMLTGERHRGRVLELYTKKCSHVDWSALPAEESYQVFFNICLAAGRCGRMDILESVFRDMRTKSIPRTEELYTGLLKICAAQRLTKEVLMLGKWMRSDRVSITNRFAWSCLCFAAAEEKEWSAALGSFRKLVAVGEPTIRDYCNALRAHVALCDAVSAFELIGKICKQGLEPEPVMWNMAFVACCAEGKHLDLAEDLLKRMCSALGTVDVITYNTLIKGYVHVGRLSDGFKVLKEMADAGCSCSVVTYGTLLDACVNKGDMDKAAMVFQMILDSGCAMNNVLFTTLMKGFAKKGQTAKALTLYQTMLDQGVEPDRVTYSTLIKSFCDNKDMKGGLAFFQDACAKGLKPDDVIFNSLLNGCANCANLELGERLFADMVSYGVQPSVSTISTMVKLYAECQALPQAVDLLKSIQAKFGLAPEQRLYVQIIHAALRARKHTLALEVFKACQDSFGLLPDVETTKLIRACIGFNLLQTAVGFVETMLETGRANSHFLQIIADTAAKKKRTAVLRSMIELADKYGIQLEGLAEP